MSARTRVIRFNHQEIEDLREAIAVTCSRLSPDQPLRQRLEAVHERLEHWYNPQRVKRGKLSS